VRPGGKIRHVRCVGAPAGDESTFQGFIGTAIDITEQEQLTQKLRQSEADFRTITNNIPGFVHTMDPTGEVAFLNNQILEYFGKAGEELKDWSKAGVVHPEDLPRVVETFKRSIETGQICEIELRCLRADGVYRWFQSRGRPVRDTDGKITAWYFLLTDIDDRKRAEQKLQQSERDLRTITDSIPQPIVVLSPDGKTLYVNQVALDLTGLTMDQLDEKGFWARIVHSDDLERLRTQRQERLLRGDPFELEFRALFKNGQYRWQLMQYTPLKDESGQIIRWYSTATDIDDRKRAEEKLRQSEENLRTITDTIRQPIWVLAPDGTILYANRVVRELTGLTTSDVNDQPFTTRVFDPDDRERVRAERHEGLLRGAPFEMEGRILLKSGQYRWHLVQYNPLKDESGQIIRWYATATDIDDRKKTEERLHNENLELREEIDRSSMFEEIVGSSKPMSQLLKKVEKVAPSDSTVLILGETGTGKELIARALHRRSKRASRAFVKVNCAAIPQSLIASELFGHEKGAFTGALQRRLGRFEAANGGTLFLDEIGELPMETQIAFLRVLQEREFERVGSNHPISVDVRLIAATNRDLPNAVAAGTFRQDLFYRLDVFPIAVPPLRERAEDIPLLVEYFVGRFAKDAGKNIRHIGKQTLEQLQSYRWPGNIRELQNVVERAVILCETDTFVVDESWLESESEESSQREGLSALGEREVEMIEAALAETHGRISGPAGAAAKLGIPRQTLESKIRRLGIDKYGQKRPTT
jgi:formate hydrogenlyase transcriptional activator